MQSRYDPTCDDGYIGAGLEIRTKGDLFAALAVDGYDSLADTGCGRTPEWIAGDSLVVTEGWLQLDDGGHLRSAVGYRVPISGWISVEAAASVGVSRLRPDSYQRYEWQPWVGTMFGASFLRNHILVQIEPGWNRIPFRREVYACDSRQDFNCQFQRAPAIIERSKPWARMTSVRFGLRL